MTRIDRKTGELILSPKLTVDQLYAMANEPGWRPWMRLIAEHPHAWPELIPRRSKALTRPVPRRCRPRPCAAAVASPYHPRRCRRKTSRGRNPCLRRRSSLLPTIPRRRP